MSRSFEARLAKVEAAIAPRQMGYEEWLATLAGVLPLTAAEVAEIDMRIVADAVNRFGSLAAAAVATRAEAQRTRNPLDDLFATDMERRADDLTRVMRALEDPHQP